MTIDYAPTQKATDRAAAIDRLIEAEQARFASRHPKSAAAWARGREHYLYGGPSHWMRRWAGGFPIYAEAASGAHIQDIDGHDYVDFCLGDTGGMCGHAPEPVTRAALHQLQRGTTMMLPTLDSLWVGEELTRRFGLPYWTLTTSATDANRGAIRIARMITGRDKVLVFSGCYHGGVEEAHVEIRNGKIGMRNMIHPNAVDHAAVSRVVEFNDVAALEQALKAGDVACVLTEPLMTNFGMIPVEPGFHDALRRLTRETGTLLVIDETHTISCGPGGYTALNGLEPDMLVAGKAIAGGIPAGIFGLSQAVAERMWQIVPHANPKQRQSAHLGIGGTLAGNALTVATMKAVLEEVLTEANYARMIALATRLADEARALISRSRRPWHVTQIGARAEIMFTPKVPRSGADVIATRQGDLETLLHAFYMNEGILVTPFHTMFLMCPASTEEDVARHTEVFARFIELLEREGIAG
ncbi:aminotransferase class III-fold pyridoxal phosphate-dependent enzyme [Microvirga tunisiensis]|uniref:Aminotransferase class III-fold pyridoxal phosphate-dependent enzyme n=1 Tax=Pannonibacter tanglangensis TaxID=2750084 RepID=A0A7X5F4H5_9HYPH|nr:transaminase [Pannonibacter sp. XCT-53]NBN79608.1 aminotransferase class III-fold pyridoxal phosphate-dependent enzyme [Pannonibacter sp. XCT-53]